MEEFFKTVTTVMSTVAEGCGAVVIGYAVVRAAVSFILNLFQVPVGEVPRESIRLNLGRSLSLGLEFLLGADILKTAISPSWEEVGLLAAIAAIRTGLNFFLQKELESATNLERSRISRGEEIPPPHPRD